MPRPPGLAATLAVCTLGCVLLAGMTHAALFAYAHGNRPPLFGLQNLSGGLWFTLGLLGPVSLHEAAHLVSYRHYGVRWSGPYAIPLPLFITGTAGAFIRLESPYPSRESMIVSGAAGPLAGFLGVLPAAWFGLKWSLPVSALIGGTRLKRFGMPHLFSWWTHGSVVLHPLAAGAWISCLLTMINLLPMEHFDGGTILHGLHAKTARVMSVVMIGLSFVLAAYSLTWGLVLAVQVLVLIFAGWQQHPTHNEELPTGIWTVPALALLALWATWATI